jgi:hypothetical protein
MSDFAEKLHKSHIAVITVVDRLISPNGWDVFLPGRKIAKDREHYKDAVDKGDFLFKYLGKWRRAEVKQTGCHFTSIDDWKYPTFFICSTHSYDLAIRKPYVYIFINPSLTHIGVLDVSRTRHTWKIAKNVKTKGRAEVQDVYYTTKDQIDFKPLPEAKMLKRES